MPHLVLDISAHGFGHLAQATPVIEALLSSRPDLKITIRTAIPSDIVRSFVGANIEVADPPPAAVLVMDGPSHVDRKASFQAYRRLHQRWQDRVSQAAQDLQALRPDVLVSDVDYLGLAAAAALGLPAIAMSSLNWADIAEAYIANQPGASDILHQMRDAYESVAAFIRFSPGLPMSWHPSLSPVGPVARIGRCDATLRQRLHIAPETRLGLFSFGGIAGPKGGLSLARVPGVHWLIGGDISLVRDDVTPVTALNMSFIDILASVDFVVTKPGYGTFAEATCNGIGIIHTIRDDWAEYGPFCDWLAQHAHSIGLPEAALRTAALDDAIDTLLAMTRPDAPPPSGGAEAAQIIARLLS